MFFFALVSISVSALKMERPATCWIDQGTKKKQKTVCGATPTQVLNRHCLDRRQEKNPHSNSSSVVQPRNLLFHFYTFRCAQKAVFVPGTWIIFYWFPGPYLFSFSNACKLMTEAHDPVSDDWVIGLLRWVSDAAATQASAVITVQFPPLLSPAFSSQTYLCWTWTE